MDLLMLPRNISFPGGNFIGGLDEPGQPMPLKSKNVTLHWSLQIGRGTLLQYLQYEYEYVLVP